jgi:hypothetical protein
MGWNKSHRAGAGIYGVEGMLKPFLYVFAAVALFAAGYATRPYLEQVLTGSASTLRDTVAGGGDERAAKLVRVTEFHWHRNGVPAVDGVVVNGSDRAFDVTVTFNLYDPAGNEVDTFTGLVQNLQPGSEGGFTAAAGGMFLLRGVDENSLRARLVKISVSGTTSHSSGS